jgi:hypothetical protein
MKIGHCTLYKHTYKTKKERMNTQELLTRLPKSWGDINIRTFHRLTRAKIQQEDDMTNGVQNTISVLSSLLEMPEEELEDLPMKDIVILSNKIEFLLENPETPKSGVLDWKNIDEISYDNFITYVQSYENQMENLDSFVINFSKTKLTKEEILDLPVTEVFRGFFLFNRQLKKLVNYLIITTSWQLVKFHTKTKFQKPLQWFKWKKKVKSS